MQLKSQEIIHLRSELFNSIYSCCQKFVLNFRKILDYILPVKIIINVTRKLSCYHNDNNTIDCINLHRNKDLDTVDKLLHLITREIERLLWHRSKIFELNCYNGPTWKRVNPQVHAWVGWGSISHKLWVNYKSIADKKRVTPEGEGSFGGRSRAWKWPPRVRHLAKKGSPGLTKVTPGRDFWVVSEQKGSKKGHFLWP